MSNSSLSVLILFIFIVANAIIPESGTISVSDSIISLNNDLETVDIYTAKLGPLTNKDFSNSCNFDSIDAALATGASEVCFYVYLLFLFIQKVITNVAVLL